MSVFKGGLFSSGVRRPPRAPGSLFTRVQALRHAPLAYTERLANTGEPLLWLRLPGVSFYVAQDLGVIDEVLVKKHHSFIKDTYTRRLREILGKGLLTAEGAPGRRQRRLLQPAFHRRQIAGYVPDMVRLAEAMVAGFGDHEVRDVHRDLMRLTLEIVGHTLFGTDVSGSAALVGEAIELAMMRYVGTWMPLWLPTPLNRRARASLDRVHALLSGIIRERREGGSTGSDLLSLLLRAQDEDGTRMSDRQLRDECMTLFLAGHETTALNLSYTLFLLAMRPDLQEALAAEVGDVLGDRSPTFDDVQSLVACQRVIKESMRLYPPAWSIGRRAIEDVEIGGFPLPKGTEVALFMWALHRNPDRFPEPEAFRPERWTAKFERTLPRHAYMPFGGGPRICIGNTFALTEVVLVLATIVRSYRFRLAQPPRLPLQASITLRPRDGVRLRLEAR
ncbi:MAG TPA: cytochrome P450 [Nannocystis exedens]|nr:cytochrome P450 [Nannocystis exedens]